MKGVRRHYVNQNDQNQSDFFFLIGIFPIDWTEIYKNEYYDNIKKTVNEWLVTKSIDRPRLIT